MITRGRRVIYYHSHYSSYSSYSYLAFIQCNHILNSNDSKSSQVVSDFVCFLKVWQMLAAGHLESNQVVHTSNAHVFSTAQPRRPPINTKKKKIVH